MRRLPPLVLLVILVSCNRATRESPFRPTATVKDIMQSMVDPSADVLWDAVSTRDSAAGLEVHEPKTDSEWSDVRHHAVELVEATNLLLIEGRHVAKPGEQAEDRDVELPPEQIESRIAQDRQAWIALAHALHDAATVALKAAENKNSKALFDAGEPIDNACENCHLKYWYPNEKPIVPLPKP